MTKHIEQASGTDVTALECMDFVKKNVFQNIQVLKDAPEDVERYIKENTRKMFFGTTHDEYTRFLKFILMAKPNDSKETIFPDFKIPGDPSGGFIEHFAISASKCTNKGDQYHRLQGTADSKSKKTIDKMIRSGEKLKPVSNCFDIPVASHANLIENFAAIWKTHIESMKSYKGDKTTKILMVDFREFSLTMKEEVVIAWEDGMMSGDYRNGESFQCYRLSRDKEVLSFIHRNKKYVDFIIFVNNETCEFIKVDSIPFLLHFLHYPYSIYSLHGTVLSNYIPTDME